MSARLGRRADAARSCAISSSPVQSSVDETHPNMPRGVTKIFQNLERQVNGVVSLQKVKHGGLAKPKYRDPLLIVLCRFVAALSELYWKYEFKRVVSWPFMFYFCFIEGGEPVSHSTLEYVRLICKMYGTLDFVEMAKRLNKLSGEMDATTKSATAKLEESMPELMFLSEVLVDRPNFTKCLAVASNMAHTAGKFNKTRELCESSREACSQISPSMTFSEMKTNVAALGEYIDRHREDPHNTLLGLRPNILLRKAYTSHQKKETDGGRSNALAIDKRRSSVTPNNFSKHMKVINKFEGPVAEADDGSWEPTVESLSSLIINWADLSQREEIDHQWAMDCIVRQVNEVANLLSQRVAFLKGNLVVATGMCPGDTEPTLMYGRIVSVDTTSCGVTFDFLEEKRQTFQAGELVLVSHLLGCMVTTDNFDLKELVESPVDALISHVHSTIDEEIWNSLRISDVPESVIAVLRSPQSTLPEGIVSALDSYLETYRLLTSQNSGAFSFALSQLHAELRKTVSKHRAQKLDKRRFYPFTFTEQMTVLLKFEAQLERYVGIKLNSATEVVQRIITRIEEASVEMLNGVEKRSVMSWYLSLITHEVRNFLAKKNYKFDAYDNEDYISRPPSDMATIHANMQIINDILNPHNKASGVRELVESLRDRVYSRLEVFQNNVVVVVRRMFARIVSSNAAKAKGAPLNGNLQDIQKYLVESAASLSDLSVSNCGHRVTLLHILDTIKDLNYLTEMKQMESEFNEPASGKHLKLSTVVPVSGLIMSRFHILEQELKTVLEVWGGKEDHASFSGVSAAPATPPPVQPTLSSPSICPRDSGSPSVRKGPKTRRRGETDSRGRRSPTQESPTTDSSAARKARGKKKIGSSSVNSSPGPIRADLVESEEFSNANGPTQQSGLADSTKKRADQSSDDGPADEETVADRGAKAIHKPDPPDGIVSSTSEGSLTNCLARKRDEIPGEDGAGRTSRDGSNILSTRNHQTFSISTPAPAVGSAFYRKLASDVSQEGRLQPDKFYSAQGGLQRCPRRRGNTTGNDESSSASNL